MLFKTRFHEGIRRGAIDLTFRLWKAAKVTPGRRYRFGADDELEVDEVAKVAAGAIRPAEASRAGFESVPELLATLAKLGTGDPLRSGTKVFRIAFHYAGKRKKEAGPHLPLELAIEKLEKMDRRSASGSWTGTFLARIAEHPRTAASRLAASVGWERAPFKANVRKLKRLGLTRSFEVGYELTPQGRAVLKRLTGSPRRRSK